MRGLLSVTPVLLLSLLAGAACSAGELPGEEGSEKKIMHEQVRLQSLQAGIELATADSRSAADEQPQVVFHVSNSSEQPVKMLIWNTPLEKELSADVFEVVHNGKPVEYLGRMVKRGEPQESDFVEVPAGGRVEATIDIARYYDISEPGGYALSYKSHRIGDVMQLNQKTPVTMDTDLLTFTVAE